MKGILLLQQTLQAREQICRWTDGGNINIYNIQIRQIDILMEESETKNTKLALWHDMRCGFKAER